MLSTQAYIKNDLIVNNQITGGDYWMKYVLVWLMIYSILSLYFLISEYYDQPQVNDVDNLFMMRCSAGSGINVNRNTLAD